MYEPEPRMIFTPTGAPYLYQHDAINAPDSGETIGPTYEGRVTPSSVGTLQRIYASVLTGPTGARAEVRLDGGTWTDGDVGLALGPAGTEQVVEWRGVAPALDPDEEESPTMVTVVHVTVAGQADWTPED
jgi:hypothetical protein